ncbi:MAG: YfhO family protein [Bacteroidaceae bacterium]|nr:YfhO family protein [Bacteroidaceae bacterium]
MRRSFFNRYGAVMAAVILFVVLSCIYCRPSLQGMIVNAGDTSSFKGMVHEVDQYQKETGEDTFWTGSLFCGMPTYQIGATHFKSTKLLKPFRKVFFAGHGTTGTPYILMLYFFCFFILLLCFGVDKWLSIAGAIAMTLSSYFIIIIPAGHITKTSTIALMSLAMGGFHLIFNMKKYWLGFIVTAIPVAVCLTSHAQMAYYICLMIGLLFIAELYTHIKEKRYKDLGLATVVFSLAMLLALGANTPSILANSEYASQTMRGGHSDLVKESDAGNKTSGLDLDYATQWSYGIDETLSFIIPGVLGSASNCHLGTGSKLYKTLVSGGVDKRTSEQVCKSVPLYWGNQPFTAGNVYMGAVACFLFVLGLILVKGPLKWALAIATAFSVMLAWGHNFMPLTEFFFRFVPLYSKFRSVSSILIVAEIAMPLLGFIALNQIINGTVKKEIALRGIYAAAGFTAGICLVIAIAGKSFFSFTGVSDASLSQELPEFLYEGILAQRQAMLVNDSLRSTLFILLSAATVWLYAKGYIKSVILTIVMGILVLTDMWPVDRRYFNEDNYISAKQYSSIFEIKPYERQILSDPDPHFRVMNLTTNTFNESRTSYYLKSIGGYHAAKLRRYQDLIDRHISKINMNVISMLNAKYFITEGSDGKPTPMRNTAAMGNAWYVDTLLIVDNANQECDALDRINLHTTAVVDRQFSDFASKTARVHDPSSSVILTKYTPRYIDYESHSNSDGTVVFSEIYYPFGWKATIDGQPAEHFRANYTLRALNVPAGNHKIRFEFDPDSVRKGNAISMICILLIYAVIMGTVAASIIRRHKKVRSQADCG